MDAICGRIKVVRCAAKFHPCPQCGQNGRRKGYLPSRYVIDVEPGGGLCTVELRVAEYRATCGCCKTFRSLPRAEDLAIEPWATYSNRVRDLVVSRLIEDNLSVDRLLHSLQRDFRLTLSEGYVHQCLEWKVRQVDLAEYRKATRERFSGTVCLDELHLGHRTLLMATDPIADLVIGFALVSRNDHDHMRAFLENLKRHGFEPKVVISDGSPLYPAVLEELWPKAKHQLCVFHLLKEINGDILDALRRLRKEAFPKRRVRKGRRGRPRKERAAAMREAKRREEQSKFVWDHRHLVVTASENLDHQDQLDWSKMVEAIPGLRELRQFALEVRGVLDPRRTRRQAWSRFQKLQGNPSYQRDPDLSRALKKLRREKFAKAIEYLNWTHRRKIRTNNHVERMNRRIRLQEKVRYGWRKRRSVVRFIVLSLDRIHQDRKQQPPSPKRCVKRRPKRKVGT
jgi:transposase-like protein